MVFKAVDLTDKALGHGLHIAKSLRILLAIFLMATGLMMSGLSSAHAETRSLKLYYIHTGEKAEIVFKRNGRYVQSGLKKLNRFLRDWRRNEPTKMDPRLFDLVWEVYRSVRARDYIHVVSAYRSPKTNSMLRRTRGGQAKKSQHMYGRAMDFFIPGVKLSKLRATAMKMQGGGVGYYPRSGSPFVHLDVAGVRAWPRMSRKQLSRLFPNGKTLHLPSDGKPLPGYNQALAEYKRRKGKPIVIDKSTGADRDRGKSLLAALFGGGADEEEEASGEVARVTRKQTPPAAVAPATKPATTPQPEPEPQAAQPRPETIIASLPRNAVPIPSFAPRVQERPAEAAIAAVDTAPRETEENVQEKVALDVPVPSRRPDYTPVSTEIAEQPVIVTAVAPTARPRNETEAMLASLSNENDRLSASEPLVVAPRPTARPELRPRLGSQQNTAVAAIPQPRPSRNAVPVERTTKTGRLSASPRSAAESAHSPNERLAAVLGSVKVTEKSQRPDASMAPPAPRSIVVPVQSDDAFWALKAAASSQSVAQKPEVNQALRSKPAQVIAVGFSRDGSYSEPNRFTGKAVTFLNVVRFRQSN